MCSQADFPPYDDDFPANGIDPFVAPEPTAPRRYVLSGGKPSETEPRGSVALAVLGEMLTEAEHAAARYPGHATDDDVYLLRKVRDRIAEAEAAL